MKAGKLTLTAFTKYFLDMMFFTGIIVCLSLPWLMNIFGQYFPVYLKFYLAMIIIFEIAGIMGLKIVYELRKIFKTVLVQNCFVRENVKSLKSMGGCAFIIVFLMASRLFFVITPSILVLILVFFLAGIFSLVLAQLFETAIIYKEENDLTI